MMRAFADLLADQLNRDLEQSRTQDEKRQRVLGAFAAQQVRIVYQPIVNLQTHRMAGAECLSRFRCAPTRPPDQWFAEAAEVGLRTKLELYAIEMALANLSVLAPEFYLAVNTSPETLTDPGLMRLLQGVDARRVVIEITEHARLSARPPHVGRGHRALLQQPNSERSVARSNTRARRSNALLTRTNNARR
jgi:EAL domain-containing protein (putative c-di-GMP-specific phosphodiesterase class I)